MTKLASRKIEMIVCVTYGNDNGQWHTEYIDIPGDTPEARLREVAVETFYAGYQGEDYVAHVDVYNIPSPEEEADDLKDRYLDGICCTGRPTTGWRACWMT